jgi:hypothetical protein
MLADFGKALDIIEYLLPLVPPSLLESKNTTAESTPLHWAALNGHLAVVKKLVLFEGGPGVNLIDLKNKSGRSPLAEAEMAGWDEGAQWLVEKMNLDKEGAGEQGDAEDEQLKGVDITVEIEDADGKVAKMSIGGGSQES